MVSSSATNKKEEKSFFFFDFLEKYVYYFQSSKSLSVCAMPSNQLLMHYFLKSCIFVQTVGGNASLFFQSKSSSPFCLLFWCLCFLFLNLKKEFFAQTFSSFLFFSERLLRQTFREFVFFYFSYTQEENNNVFRHVVAKKGAGKFFQRVVLKLLGKTFLNKIGSKADYPLTLFFQ